MFLVYLVTLIFTPSSEGINFVYSTGDLLKSYNFLIPNIIFLWPFLTFLFLILPTQGVQYFLYKFFKRKITLKPKKSN